MAYGVCTAENPLDSFHCLTALRTLLSLHLHKKLRKPIAGNSDDRLWIRRIFSEAVALDLIVLV